VLVDETPPDNCVSAVDDADLDRSLSNKFNALCWGLAVFTEGCCSVLDLGYIPISTELSSKLVVVPSIIELILRA
jgi:hypothetical protein